MNRGRPLEPDMALVAEICEEIATSSRSLRATLEDVSRPSVVSWYRWIENVPEIREQYTRAKSLQADFLIDDGIEIADLASPDDVQVARLRWDARRWVAGKAAPKKYGDRVTAEHVGKDGGPIETTTDTPAKLAQALLGMLHAAGTQETPE